jgi:hypothetical protein
MPLGVIPCPLDEGGNATLLGQAWLAEDLIPDNGGRHLSVVVTFGEGLEALGPVEP